MTSQLDFKCVKDLDEAKKLWEIFSPNKTIFDSWDFRYCFYKYFKYELFFYVTYDGEIPVALMPLQYNSDKKYLEFFGGYYMEDNQVFVKSPEFKYLIPEFYKNIQGLSQPSTLIYIRSNDDFTSTLPFQVNKYVLSLDGITNIEDYLSQRLDQEARGKFRRKIRKIEQEKVEITENEVTDLEVMFNYNLEKFQDHSYFTTPFSQEIFRDLVAIGYKIHIMSFSINGIKEATSFALTYKDNYAYLNLGVKPGGTQNLTTFVHMKNLEKAISEKLNVFDAFIGDYGWKEHWHLDKIPQYQFIKP